MKEKYNAIVVGAGVGGLCAATLLGARMGGVLLLESEGQVGGKAAVATVDGVEMDTGPSVLTLPEVFDEVFACAGMRREDQLPLLAPSPNFRYLFDDGVELDVHHQLDATLASVRHALGSRASTELASYLRYAQRIWEAAAPHFVFSAAPSLGQLLLGGLRAWSAVGRVDPLRTLSAAIDAQVSSPHLRRVLRRYATYNGSDARRAPATLGCIAHVELALGGYGVKGGMAQLPRALARAAREVGVDIQTQTRVARLQTSGGRITGVQLASGQIVCAPHVVMNGDVGSLTEDFAPGAKAASTARHSMSAYCGLLKANKAPQRAPHTVVFPADYEQEFSDIFDHNRVPDDPTLYLCSQGPCHGRSGWAAHEPLFCMINAPPVGPSFDGGDRPLLKSKIQHLLVSRGLGSLDDRLVWWRTPQELAKRFPGSNGALYGAASNNRTAAFARPNNRSSSLSGLYLASGSAHPGGGLPMVAQSAKLAARALLEDAVRGSA